MWSSQNLIVGKIKVKSTQFRVDIGLILQFFKISQRFESGRKFGEIDIQLCNFSELGGIRHKVPSYGFDQL